MSLEEVGLLRVAIVLIVSGVLGFVVGTVGIRIHDYFTKGEKK